MILGTEKRIDILDEQRIRTERFVRCLPGRLRISIRGIRKQARAARMFERFCLEIPGVHSVAASEWTGRVLVLFDEKRWAPERLEHQLLALESFLCGQNEWVATAREFWSTKGALAVKDDWSILPPEEVLQSLQSDRQGGLSIEEAETRQRFFGPNRMPEGEPQVWYRTLLRQFSNFTTLTMISISALPIFLGRIRDTAGVLFILGVNAIIGTYQEQKAQRDLLALKRLDVHLARVIRSGREVEVPAHELVPGDILRLEAGDRIPADAILLESWNVEIDESALTGESVPVSKEAAAVSAGDTSLAERRNMVYMGTFMTRGHARAIVVTTGRQTEMGKLVSVLQKTGIRPTPLQQRLSVVARTLVIVALLIAGLVVLVRYIQGYTLIDTLMTGVSVATTAISEGLPIMITVSLVAGMRRMVRHKAVVRNLSALETLAKVDVICSDKTGTLTKNEMTVRAIVCGERRFTVTGDGYEKHGAILEEGEPVSLSPGHDLLWTVTAAVLCNDAQLVSREKGASWGIQGDPTEAALLVAAAKAGLSPDELRQDWRRIAEIPFDSVHRSMTVACQNRQGKTYVFAKGSVDVILENCDWIRKDGEVCELTPSIRSRILEREREAAGQAMRVLAVAYRPVREDENLLPERMKEELIFSGLFAMMDPPREDVRESIDACQRAGIRVVMITGDHPRTAEAIGRELGIANEGDEVLTGTELARLTDEELMERSKKVSIYSRVSPNDKQRIVSILQKRGLIVAMTGDGINDAPALKQADVGIALGSGMDVAKESSSLVMTDDHFSAIVKAIRQGRSVLGNIRSTIGYIFTGNFAEVLYASLVVLSGLPLPLMPIQMMFMNLLTDSLPTLILTMGRSDARKNRPTDAQLPHVRDVFDAKLAARVLASGFLVGLGTTVLYMGVSALTGQKALAGTVALAALCIGKLAQVSYWRQVSGEAGNSRRDAWMKGTLGVSLAGLVTAIYLPHMQFLFNSVPLGLHHWALILGTVYMARHLAAPLADWLQPHLQEVKLFHPANSQSSVQVATA
jgi:Ca2+-transporting ATPase